MEELLLKQLISSHEFEGINIPNIEIDGIMGTLYLSKQGGHYSIEFDPYHSFLCDPWSHNSRTEDDLISLLRQLSTSKLINHEIVSEDDFTRQAQTRICVYTILKKTPPRCYMCGKDTLNHILPCRHPLCAQCCDKTANDFKIICDICGRNINIKQCARIEN